MSDDELGKILTELDTDGDGKFSTKEVLDPLVEKLKSIVTIEEE